jgi:8-oxo-dGTP pyrophosphatase MutT (NUDIX family)
MARSIPSFDPRLSPLVQGGASTLEPVAVERLRPEWLRERFELPPDWTPEATSDRMRLHDGPPRPAAVLVPIVAHGSAPTVMLTQRTLHLRQHSGQVAFPGGRCEPADLSPIHTALRETQEEVGLEPERVEVIGQLPEYLTGTGFRITPIVGLVRPGFVAHPDPNEVAAVFEVPLGFLMDPRHHQQRRIELPDGARSFWAIPYRPQHSADEYFIWGATAAMIRNLYRLLIA